MMVDLNVGCSERLQNHGCPFEGDCEEHPIFSPGPRRKEVSAMKISQLLKLPLLKKND